MTNTEEKKTCPTMTDDEYRETVRRIYPNMSEEEIQGHLDKAPRDAQGRIVRGEDMFDFSGYLRGMNGTPGIVKARPRRLRKNYRGQHWM